jgi:multicomponent K+:H+ antiporter subunit A
VTPAVLPNAASELWLLALLPWLGAAAVACVPTRSKRGAAWLAGAVALAALALVFASAPAVFGGAVLAVSVPWLPALGLDLGFRMDGLAWLFALLITGIGALIVLYAAWYLDPQDPAGRFFTFLLMFMGAMLGVVLASNLLLLVLFWELTSLSSFLLIGYWHHRQDARQGARMALTITGAGGLCLLAGVLLLGHMVGSYQLADGAVGRLYEERAVPVSLLAAACHGRTHAGVGLPALGHHGEVRCVLAGALLPRAGRQ